MHKNLLRGTRVADWFEFVASRDGSGVNVVTPDPDTLAHWFVSVNGERTDMPVDSLSFKEGDVVRITYSGFQGRFDGRDQDYFLEMRGTLPFNGYGDYQLAFNNCRSLRKVSENLLERCRIYQGYGFFMGCESLEEIPKGFCGGGFRIQPARNMFSGCTALKKIHIDEFAGLQHLYDSPHSFFADCTSLQTELRFRAVTTISPPQHFARYLPHGAITLYMPPSLADMFRKGRGNENLIIIEE